tara:strand:+ start:286 stop:582 length:297 start_codon:yes stop_codon:yes gene_type:complete
MAINKQKIPSPSEIKSSPQSFSKEELDQLKELRLQLNQTTFQLGQLYINKIKIENAESDLKKQYKTLEQKEKDIAKSLSDKYGKGSIDLDSGTFTPLK